MFAWWQRWVQIGRKVHQKADPLPSSRQLIGLQVRELGVDSPQSFPHVPLELPGPVPVCAQSLLPSSGDFQALGQVLSTCPVEHQGLRSLAGLFGSQPAAQGAKRRLVLVLDEQQLGRLGHAEEETGYREEEERMEATPEGGSPRISYKVTEHRSIRLYVVIRHRVSTTRRGDPYRGRTCTHAAIINAAVPTSCSLPRFTPAVQERKRSK
ncbi:hypothetical protein EYF80_035700 [Liparis tanakae]|uniref:Uncharacterized protein n=1 Tax=Liparis tanakae TaxID=230148 RepID=A0A4Z2GL73_9TELE|nr:hypothetical protein EYF80_035700 [Liparis tanakae]